MPTFQLYSFALFFIFLFVEVTSSSSLTSTNAECTVLQSLLSHVASSLFRLRTKLPDFDSTSPGSSSSTFDSISSSTAPPLPAIPPLNPDAPSTGRTNCVPLVTSIRQSSKWLSQRVRAGLLHQHGRGSSSPNDRDPSTKAKVKAAERILRDLDSEFARSTYQLRLDGKLSADNLTTIHKLWDSRRDYERARRVMKEMTMASQMENEQRNEYDCWEGGDLDLTLTRSISISMTKPMNISSRADDKDKENDDVSPPEMCKLTNGTLPDIESSLSALATRVDAESAQVKSGGVYYGSQAQFHPNLNSHSYRFDSYYVKNYPNSNYYQSYSGNYYPSSNGNYYQSSSGNSYPSSSGNYYQSSSGNYYTPSSSSSSYYAPAAAPASKVLTEREKEMGVCAAWQERLIRSLNQVTTGLEPAIPRPDLAEFALETEIEAAEREITARRKILKSIEELRSLTLLPTTTTPYPKILQDQNPAPTSKTPGSGLLAVGGLLLNALNATLQPTLSPVERMVTSMAEDMKILQERLAKEMKRNSELMENSRNASVAFISRLVQCGDYNTAMHVFKQVANTRPKTFGFSDTNNYHQSQQTYNNNQMKMNQSGWTEMELLQEITKRVYLNQEESTSAEEEDEEGQDDDEANKKEKEAEEADDDDDDEKREENLQKLLHFLDRMESLPAYKLLFENMIAQDDGKGMDWMASTPLILTMAYAIERLTKTRDQENPLKFSMHTPTSKLLRSMGEKVSKMGGGAMTELQPFISSNPHVFNHYVGGLVRSSYTAGNRKNGENNGQIVQFLGNLPSNPPMIATMMLEGRAQGLDALYHQMKIEGHLDSPNLLVLAHLVMDTDWTDVSSSNGGRKMERLVSELPGSVRALLGRSSGDDDKKGQQWSRFGGGNGTVVLESAATENPGYTLYSSTIGNLFTYPHNNYPDGRNQQFRVTDVGDGRLFLFQNVAASGRWLCSDGKGKALGGAKVDNDLFQTWIVTPVEGPDDWVWLRNGGDGAVLDAGPAQPCMSSRKCCCSSVKMTDEYEATETQHWRIRPLGSF